MRKERDRATVGCSCEQQQQQLLSRCRTLLCPGGRYASCKAAEPLLRQLKEDILPRAEKAADDAKCASFYRAVTQWLSSEAIYATTFERYDDFLLDYLLQMIVSGDAHAWIELIDLSAISALAQAEADVSESEHTRALKLESMQNAKLLTEFRIVLYVHARQNALR